MLIIMKRGRINTVTDFPVLIHASSEEREGVATFLTELAPLELVRALRDSDLKGASRAMSKYEAKHFAAVMMWRHALRSQPDPLALEKAGELLRQSYELKRKQREETQQRSTKWE